MGTTTPIYPSVEEERYLALLRATNAIATCSDCCAASDTVAKYLRDVTPFDCLQLVAFDRETNAPNWCLLEVNGKRLESSVEAALLELMRDGAEFACTGVLAKYVLSKLARKCRTRPRCAKQEKQVGQD